MTKAGPREIEAEIAEDPGVEIKTEGEVEEEAEPGRGTLFPLKYS